MRGPSFADLGKRPDLTPAHHVDLLTGITPSGAMMDGSRTKPVSGRLDGLAILVPRQMISDEDDGAPDQGGQGSCFGIRYRNFDIL